MQRLSATEPLANIQARCHRISVQRISRRLVVAVLGLCRIDILLAVWLFAIAVSL